MWEICLHSPCSLRKGFSPLRTRGAQRAQPSVTIGQTACRRFFSTGEISNRQVSAPCHPFLQTYPPASESDPHTEMWVHLQPPQAATLIYTLNTPLSFLGVLPGGRLMGVCYWDSCPLT